MATTLLKIKALPGAHKSEIVGWLGDALKVRLREPAEKNLANKALIDLLARVLGVPARKIRLQRGHRSSQKQLLIEGIDSEAIDRAFGHLRD